MCIFLEHVLLIYFNGQHIFICLYMHLSWHAARDVELACTSFESAGFGVQYMHYHVCTHARLAQIVGLCDGRKVACYDRCGCLWIVLDFSVAVGGETSGAPDKNKYHTSSIWCGDPVNLHAALQSGVRVPTSAVRQPFPCL